MSKVPADLAPFAAAPPLFRLLGTADVFGASDGHTNPTWRGMAGRDDREPAIPMAIKYLGSSSPKISIELACGLAAMALKLPVPVPALVICEREDLPSIPASVTGNVLLLFGSTLHPEDTLWAKAKVETELIADLIWRRVCDDIVGAKGAAWDELIANPDRHHHNLLFDGLRWWLFDHDKAIPPFSDGQAKAERSRLAQEFPTFYARTNLLALEMFKRHPSDHGVTNQPADFEKNKKRLTLLADEIAGWRTADVRINGVLQDAAFFSHLIASRVPSLALHLSRRLGVRDGESLWT